MTKLKPKKTYVVLKPIDEPSFSGLIHVPDTAKKKINQGIVIAKGSLVDDWIDIGDHVVFNAYSGEKIVLESGIFYILHDTEIHAVLIESSVKLIDTETVKRLIKDKIFEMRSKSDEINLALQDVNIALIDLIDTIQIREGLEF